MCTSEHSVVYICQCAHTCSCVVCVNVYAVHHVQVVDRSDDDTEERTANTDYPNVRFTMPRAGTHS